MSKNNEEENNEDFTLRNTKLKRLGRQEQSPKENGEKVVSVVPEAKWRKCFQNKGMISSANTADEMMKT